MRLSASDLALIRNTQSHYTDLYLSVFQPIAVLKCQVNGSIVKGAMEITYDNVTAGSWQSVRIGATLLVGSSVGGRDVGKVRVKSITSSVITVAENFHIKWANNLYLTVLDYFDLWPVFPRIIQNPSDATKTIWYKDYDIPYSNQNTNLGAFLNIGPHRAAFIENGSAPLYFSASGTTPLSGVVSDVQWTFQSGTPSTYHGTTPGDVSWGTPGHYLTRCTVSGSAGWVETGYRYVSVYDKPDQGTNVPVLKWEMTGLQGARAEGGYTASITVFENVVVEEGSIVVLFADEWYDGNHQSLGGNAPNASKIKFVGYVMDDSIRYDYKSSSVSFEIGSITQVMKELEGFAIGLNSTASPIDWYELQDMNGKKAVYHYWKWQSNVISLADIQFIGEDFPIQYFDSGRESLFDAVDNFLRSTYRASAVSDRQGKIYLETDAWVQPNATGTFSPLFDLSKYDWNGTPNITEQRYPQLSYLEYGGIAYSGVTTGTFSPLLSEAPGSAPAYRGNSQKRSGFALGGQSQLNQLVGNEFFHANFQFPTIGFDMRGNWSNLDIAPQEAVQVNVAAGDTVRNKAVSGLYMPSSITWQTNFKNKSFGPRITWDVITSGDAGETIVIPEIVDDGGFGGRRGGGGLSIPVITPPSIPISTINAFSRLMVTNSGGAAKAHPSFSPLPFSLTQSAAALMFTSTSGTYYGYHANIGLSGYYEVSLNGSITLDGSNDDIATTGIAIYINGQLPTADWPIFLAGNYIGPYHKLSSGGFTTINYMRAGDEITLGVVSLDGADSTNALVASAIAIFIYLGI